MILGLAPMDGITDLPYRTIVKKIYNKYNNSHQLRTWTEFMNTDGYMTHPARLVKHLIHHRKEDKLIAQIYGGNPDTLIQTAQDIERKYPQFAGIELNIGCPSPKVMACGGGSGMMRDKDKCLQIIKDMSTSISKPFSIKVRAGLNEQDKQEQFHMLIQAAAYCKVISIHGRTFSQGHSGAVDRDFISRVKKELANACIIIGNGGITSYHDAQVHQEKYQIDGIMIAQAAIGDPRVFVDHKPNQSEVYKTIIEHLKLSIAYEIRRQETLKQHPDNAQYDAVLIHNQQVLHHKKKIEDDDTITEYKQKVQAHHYQIPMPSLPELEAIAQSIPNDDNTPYRACIEFRKYLFNYIKGIPGSKEVKQQIAITKTYKEIHTLLAKFLES